VIAPPGDPGWAALGARLREIGVTPEAASAALRVGRASEALPRHPLQRWSLRRRDDDAATALRLFFLADGVDADAAARALGASFEPALAAGLLLRAGDTVTCPFTFAFADELLVVSDPLDGGGDAADLVMGPGATTAELARLARPTGPCASVLDLGCGAGTLALLYAPLAARVVGTDVNPRALAFARANAALAGRDVEWRQGDLYAPVEPETFELVVAQPPFVPRPAGAAEATYLHGGARGDELARRALAGLPARLAPGGRGVVLAMWPRTGGEGLAASVGGAGLGLTIFEGPPFELDDWCTACVAREHPRLDDAFDAGVVALREHLGALGVTGFSLAAVVVERVDGARGWSATYEGVAIERLAAADVELARRAQRLAAGPDDALLAARLGVPAGASLERGRVRFAEGAPWPTLVFDDLTYAVAVTLAAAPDVRAAVEVIRAQSRAPRADILAAIRQALARGVVAPA
jgi:SAM-dependent methyltransferase